MQAGPDDAEDKCSSLVIMSAGRRTISNRLGKALQQWQEGSIIFSLKYTGKSCAASVLKGRSGCRPYKL